MPKVTNVRGQISSYGTFGSYYDLTVTMSDKTEFYVQPYIRGMFCLPLRLYIYLTLMTKYWGNISKSDLLKIEETFIKNCEKI